MDMDSEIARVKLLLDKLVSNEFVDNFLFTKLEVSLLTKMKTTLLRVQTVLDDDDHDVKDMLRDALFEVHNLFDEIDTEALRCKGETEDQTPTFKRFNRWFNGWVVNSKLRKLIERLKGLSSGEQVGELGVLECDWNGTPPASSVQVLLEKIVSSEFDGNFLSTKLDVSFLKSTLMSVQAILRVDDLLSVQAILDDDDDDVKTTLLDLQDDREILIVGLWLDMLRNAVFEVGYLFDQINREALRCRVEAEYDTLTPSQISENPSPFKLFNGQIYSKLQKLSHKLEFFSSQAISLFDSRALDGFSSKSVWHENPTCSILDDESSIFGRDNDTKKLKHLLLSSDGDDSKIGIISIVGMEGIGKTTLAKLLYNDPEVKEKFEIKLWAHVSEDLDDLSVLETILDNLITNRDDTSDVNNIYPKFLLVFDEVCDARSINWTLLMNISNVGQTGSRIIITTQDEKVALSMQTFALSMQTFLSVHYMTPLENEDCWSILAKHAFRACNDQNQSNLEAIGREIAKMCYGSPFAAVALGDILRTKLSLENWNYVLKSDIWAFTDHVVQPFIQLRYHSLPTLLKRCFAYCSIFPKKSIIEKKLVVQLWIAEGLVESSSDQKKVGEEYFDVLVSRSLIHRRSIGDGEANFEMHNL